MSLKYAEVAFLQLAATKPLKKLPEFHQQVAQNLSARGLVIFNKGQWYPTAAGLKAIHQTLH